MRYLLLVLGILLPLLGGVDAMASAEAADAPHPCCCEDVDSDDATHCCNFDGGRCCTTGSVLPAPPAGHAPGPGAAMLATLQPGAEDWRHPRVTGPPPTPPPII